MAIHQWGGNSVKNVAPFQKGSTMKKKRKKKEFIPKSKCKFAPNSKRKNLLLR